LVDWAERLGPVELIYEFLTLTPGYAHITGALGTPPQPPTCLFKGREYLKGRFREGVLK
jgi:hypothetical protein